MENYFKVSEDGQVVVDWELLEMPEELVSEIESIIKNMVNTNRVLVSIDKYVTEVDLYFSDERYHMGELIYGVYTNVNINTESRDIVFNTMGLSDIKKFGFVKGGQGK